MSQTANLHIASNIALPSPRSMVAKIAPTEAQTAFIAESRRQIRDILFGKDPRFLVVLGPCSIHDPEAGLEYGRKLAELAQELNDRLCLVMRVYFEKPRTTVGWKGLINDPGTEELLVAACENGVDLIGGCPYTDTHPNEQIDRIFKPFEPAA